MTIVKINGVRYNLVRRDLGKEKDGKLYHFGYCQVFKTEICLTTDRGTGTERKYVTFIHECLHALIAESCCRSFLKKNQEEYFVSAMEAPIASFIRDNIGILRRMGKF